MNVNTLKQIFQTRQEIEELPEVHEFAGKRIEIDFLCDFGYMSRNKRFLIKLDGEPIGLKEAYIPWNFTKEISELFILDKVILKGKPDEYAWVENPYGNSNEYLPAAWSIEDFWKVLKKYKFC
jgi:hypothetical protein